MYVAVIGIGMTDSVPFRVDFVRQWCYRCDGLRMMAGITKSFINA